MLSLLTLLTAVLATVAVWEVLRMLPVPALAQPLLLPVATALALWDPYNWAPYVAVAGGAALLRAVAERDRSEPVQAVRLARRTPPLP